jgi:hypothetical protein
MQREAGPHSLEDLDSDFVSLGRSDLDVLDAEGLVGFPGNSSLTVDDLDRQEMELAFPLDLDLAKFPHLSCSFARHFERW